MKRNLAIVAIVAGLVTGGASVRAEDHDEWELKWSNGFKLTSPDGAFQLKFGGRIQADWTFVDQDSANAAFYGPIADSNEFRRARLFFEGTVYERVRFKAQYDFAGGDPEFKDVYIEITDTPLGNVRAGHFKEPFSLEELTSSKYITFLERSLNNTFSPSRNTGIMLHDHRGDRFTWAVGAFRESDGFGDTADGSSGKANFTGRVTGLPWYEDEGERLFHVGLSATRKDLGTDSFDFDARPEVHQQSQKFVDTGTFVAAETTIYAVEAAVVAGRFWAAAEFTRADADSVALNDPSFDGHYVQAGFFLTRDDRRRYKTSAGAFDRNRPARNFGQGGPGAWEIAVRYSALDLSDALGNDPGAGELDNLSVALNWYLNPATRLMFNYVGSDPAIPGVDAGGADFVGVRFQVDF